MNVDGCAALRVAPECLFASPAHIECLPSLAGHSSPFGRIIMRFHARFQSPTRFSAHLCQKIARIATKVSGPIWNHQNRRGSPATAARKTVNARALELNSAIGREHV